jgi:hypothetical protein
MLDRRKKKAVSAEEIARAKIDAMQLRDGDPGIEEVERAMLAILQEKYGGRAQEAVVTSDSDDEATPGETAGVEGSDDEVVPEVLTIFKEQLKRDLGRVRDRQRQMGEVEKAAYLDYFMDPSSLTEEQVLGSLSNADVKKAVQMQGMGEFVGVSKGDKRVILISRGDADGSREPERFGFRADQVEIDGLSKQPRYGQKPIRITTDTPERDALMAEIGEDGLWGNSIDIRDSVKEMGLELPSDAPDFIKRELVAAVEAVTGNPFVKGRGDTYVDAVMDFDHLPSDGSMRVVNYRPHPPFRTSVYNVDAAFRRVSRGAVCVLRGSKILEA